MRYGLSFPPFCSPSAVVSLAVDAEAAGWDGFFLWDHLRWRPELRLDVHDPWVLLGAAAQMTSSMTLGTMVTPLARRRPWQVAKSLTTLDHLSEGRAALGVGVGEPSDADFGDFGDPATHKARASVLDDALDLIDALLRGGPVDHHGPHFTIRTELLPVPVQRPRPPIWVAAVAPHRKPLERARRWDGIVPISSSDGRLGPADLRAYVGQAPRPDWDVLSQWAPGVPAAEYADVGATWLIDSAWPEGDWLREFGDRVRQGPPV